MSESKNNSISEKSQVTKQRKTKKAIAVIDKRQAIIDADEGGMNYLARSVIQATLPHSDPKSDSYMRKDGNYTLMLRGHLEYGLPYGVIPRLILAWITTEAVRTKSKELILGESLSNFLEEIGLSRSGGKRGDITRLKNQLRRLLSCSISFTYNDRYKTLMDNTTLIERAEIWWLPLSEDEEKLEKKSKKKSGKNNLPTTGTLFSSHLILSDKFFNDITRNPIPVRIETLRALKNSALDLDVYFWLTMQNGRPGASTRLIPYELLQEQFGAGYPKTQRGRLDFKKNFLLSIERVGLVYPAVKLLKDEGKEGLLYVPGEPDVSKKD